MYVWASLCGISNAPFEIPRNLAHTLEGVYFIHKW